MATTMTADSRSDRRTDGRTRDNASDDDNDGDGFDDSNEVLMQHVHGPGPCGAHASAEAPQAIAATLPTVAAAKASSKVEGPRLDDDRKRARRVSS